MDGVLVSKNLYDILKQVTVNKTDAARVPQPAELEWAILGLSLKKLELIA